MKDVFAEYYLPSEEDFTGLWSNGIVAFDSSALLNLYFYSDKTAETYLSVMGMLKERLWLPYQAGLEYQRNRLGVISKAAKGYSEAKKSLAAISIQVHARTQPPFLDSKLVDRFDAVAAEITEAFDQAVRSFEKRPMNDPIRERLDGLFSGRVGTGFQDKELNAIYSEGRERYKAKVPPGYKDEKEKPGNDCFGDLVIWKELMERAKAESKPLIFVTDDAKEDWWLIQNDKTIGPRPELLREFVHIAGQGCYIYSSDGFLLYADRYLTATLDPGVLAEVRDANLRDRLLSFERGYEDFAIPYDDQIDRSRAAVEELNPESDQYLNAVEQHDRLTDRKLASAFSSMVLPTLSPGIQQLRTELTESIRFLLAECRSCDTWDDRSEYKLPGWLEYVEEGMIPFTSLPKLQKIKSNLQEYLARHRTQLSD